MPFKFHEPRRHRVPKARYRVRNWAEYDRGLVSRGDVRVWISAEALAGWKAACRTKPGGQRHFSNLAIETVLVLGNVYGLPLRQTEGFVRSLIELMRLDLKVPDHTDSGQASSGCRDDGLSLATQRTYRHCHRQHRLEIPRRGRMGESQTR